VHAWLICLTNVKLLPPPLLDDEGTCLLRRPFGSGKTDSFIMGPKYFTFCLSLLHVLLYMVMPVLNNNNWINWQNKHWQILMFFCQLIQLLLFRPGITIYGSTWRSDKQNVKYFGPIIKESVLSDPNGLLSKQVSSSSSLVWSSQCFLLPELCAIRYPHATAWVLICEK